MDAPENIERQEEKESSSVWIKSKHHSVIEFHLIKASEIMIETSGSLCDYGNKFKDCHTDHIQRNLR